MGELENKKIILDNLKVREGEYFEYKEDKIFEEYEAKYKNKLDLTTKIIGIIGSFIGSILILSLFFLVLADSLKGGGYMAIGFFLLIFVIILGFAINNIFLDVILFTLYSTSLILLTLGFSSSANDLNKTLINISIIALTVLVLNKNFFIISYSILVISGCFLFYIYENKLYDLIYLYFLIYSLLLSLLTLNEAVFYKNGVTRHYIPILIGILISFISGLYMITLNSFKYNTNFGTTSIIFAFTLLLLIKRIINILEIKNVKNKIITYILSVLIIVSTFPAPSILGAFIVILSCFLINYKIGFVLGLISLLVLISDYYYYLNYTLLEKSIVLILSGIIFLGFYYFIKRYKVKTNE